MLPHTKTKAMHAIKISDTRAQKWGTDGQRERRGQSWRCSAVRKKNPNHLPERWRAHSCRRPERRRCRGSRGSSQGSGRTRATPGNQNTSSVRRRQYGRLFGDVWKTKRNRQGTYLNIPSDQPTNPSSNRRQTGYLVCFHKNRITDQLWILQRIFRHLSSIHGFNCRIVTPFC